MIVILHPFRSRSPVCGRLTDLRPPEKRFSGGSGTGGWTWKALFRVGCRGLKESKDLFWRRSCKLRTSSFSTSSRSKWNLLQGYDGKVWKTFCLKPKRLQSSSSTLICRCFFPKTLDTPGLYLRSSFKQARVFLEALGQVLCSTKGLKETCPES